MALVLGYPSISSLETPKSHQKDKGPQERGLLTVLVAPVPCPIHGAIWKDPQEVSPVAAVEEFGLLVIPRRQIELLGQG